MIINGPLHLICVHEIFLGQSRMETLQEIIIRRGCQQEEERHTSSLRRPRITCDFYPCLYKLLGAPYTSLLLKPLFLNLHTKHSILYRGLATMISVVQGGDLHQWYKKTKNKTAAASQIICSMTSGCGLILHTIFFFFTSLPQLTPDLEWRGSHTPKCQKKGASPGESFASALPPSSRSSNTSSSCWQIAAAFSPMPAFYIYPACLADDVASSWPRALLDVSEELQCMCKCVSVCGCVCVAYCNVPHRFASLPLS